MMKLSPTFLLLITILLAACSSNQGVTPSTSPAAVAAVEMTETATPTQEFVFVGLDEIEIDYGRFEGDEFVANVFLAPRWREIIDSISTQNMTIPLSIKIIDISANNVLIEAVQTGDVDDYPEGTILTLSHEREVMIVTLVGANDALNGESAVELAIGIDGLPVALDENGSIVAYIDSETGLWATGSIALASEVISQTTPTPKIDLTYIPGTTKESDFPLTDKDEMWPLSCSLEGIVIPETPIPYGDTGYVITAYAEKCKFGEGKIINNLVLAIRNPTEVSELLLYGQPLYGGPLAPYWALERAFQNAYFTEGRRVLIRLGRKNDANAEWLPSGSYAAPLINAQPNLEEFAQTGDPSLLGEWLIPGLVYPQVSTEEVN